MERRRVRIVVRGLVQGVGFRHHTRQKGTALELTGFVRNALDGSVVVEAQGDRVNELITWLKVGPQHAVVKSVEIEELTLSGDERSFEIAR
jgi:acylphosphatase